MILYIAEKPSMAKEIALNLEGSKQSGSGYINVGDNTIVTWAVGHILEQAAPDVYDEKYKKWNSADLPIIPENWQLIVSERTKKQFAVVKDLIKKADEIINAGDPDREGQLLVDEILDYVGNKKPVKRLLLNALDEKTVKKALKDLKNNKDFQNLKYSALARSRADWLIGMNLSRAYTIAAKKAGHEIVLPVGRVKTPTLALVVRREEEIQNFKPVTYYLLKASFLGGLTGLWQAKEEQAGLDEENRLTDKVIADELLNKIQDYSKNNLFADITSVKKEKKSTPQPLGFSLSALQLEAGKKYGYTPQEVLETAQSLYEKKLTSYPRSDCEYLPLSQLEDATNIIENLKTFTNADIAKWAEGANLEIKSRVWNDSKITAHHAIIPTEQKAKQEQLSEAEKNIYFLICRRYLSQFYPVHEYEQTKIVLHYADETFQASGRTILVNGWKSLFTADTDEEEKQEEEIPQLNEGEQAEYLASRLDEKKTTPPKRFTPSTLLEAMKNIHKYVKDKDAKKQLKDVAGIGTEATRAGIIQEIQDKGFVKTDKKSLVPTEQGKMLISLLPDELTYADTTAEWESRLEEIKDGKYAIDAFMTAQKKFVGELCQSAKQTEVTQADGERCPDCQKGILKQRQGKNGKFWGCNRYPECSATFPDEKGKPQLIQPEREKCTCGGSLVPRNGKNGKFWACNKYPECKTTFDDYKGKPDRAGQKKVKK